MLSGVLNSANAVNVSVQLIRAFQVGSNIQNTSLNFIKDQFEQICAEQFKKLPQMLAEQVSKEQRSQSLPQSLSSFPVIQNPIQVELIQANVAQYFKMKVRDLKSSNRTRMSVLPRQIAIYLIREETKLPYAEIGRFFGGKDHSTVLHAYQKVRIALSKDGTTQEAVLTIKKTLVR